MYMYIISFEYKLKKGKNGSTYIHNWHDNHVYSFLRNFYFFKFAPPSCTRTEIDKQKKSGGRKLPTVFHEAS